MVIPPITVTVVDTTDEAANTDDTVELPADPIWELRNRVSTLKYDADCKWAGMDLENPERLPLTIRSIVLGQVLEIIREVSP